MTSHFQPSPAVLDHMRRISSKRPNLVSVLNGQVRMALRYSMGDVVIIRNRD
jgi:hypothetical protein